MSRSKFNCSPFIVAHYSDAQKATDEDNKSSSYPGSTKTEAKPEPYKTLKALKSILSTSSSRHSGESSTKTSTTPVQSPGPPSPSSRQVKWLDSPGPSGTETPGGHTTDSKSDYLAVKPSIFNKQARKAKSTTNLAASPPPKQHTVTSHWEEHVFLNLQDLPTLRKLWPPPCCPASPANSLSCIHGYRRAHARSMPEGGHEQQISTKELEMSLERYELEGRAKRLRGTQSECLPLPNHDDEDNREEKDTRRWRGHKIVKAMKARVTGPARFQRMYSRRLASRRASVSDVV